MTEYADIDQTATLLEEQERIQAALDMLDDEGTVTWQTIGPTAASQTPDATPIALPVADAPQSLLSVTRSALNRRFNEINKELRDLGVTGTPPDHAGGPPIVETQPV
jgi:hypothetical protein